MKESIKKANSEFVSTLLLLATFSFLPALAIVSQVFFAYCTKSLPVANVVMASLPAFFLFGTFVIMVYYSYKDWRWDLNQIMKTYNK
jgi:membrane protein YdbS with pleckstrin-like domain